MSYLDGGVLFLLEHQHAAVHGIKLNLKQTVAPVGEVGGKSCTQTDEQLLGVCVWGGGEGVASAEHGLER